jgi:hypothetical protein
MAKMFVATIGYTRYAVPIQDAPHLLMLLGQLRRVERPDWKDPYQYAEEDEPICSGLDLCDVIEPVPPAPIEPAPPPPPPLVIGHTPKLPAPDTEMPF